MNYTPGSQLLMLPFDHRASFAKIIGVKDGAKPSKEQVKQIENYKEIIYDAYMKCVGQRTVTKQNSAVLVDSQYGKTVMKRAAKDGVIFATCMEKSGQEIFDFEYPDYKKTIKVLQPTIIKVLVRYNPENKKTDNELQLKRLKELHDYCKSIAKPFLFELLVIPNDLQLKKYGKENFDAKERAKLTIRAINEIHAAGIEPQIWKIEGEDEKETMYSVVSAAVNQKAKTGVIVLGRGENEHKVEQWLNAAKEIPGVIGFAVGRTVFQTPLLELAAGKIKRELAVKKISDEYAHFVNLWSK